MGYWHWHIDCRFCVRREESSTFGRMAKVPQLDVKRALNVFNIPCHVDYQPMTPVRILNALTGKPA